MKPILYEATETSFINRGLGTLTDCIKAIVTEEVNGQFNLELEYPIDGQHWSDISLNRIILAQPSDGVDTEPFRIYQIKKGVKKASIYAHHISYDLAGIPVEPFTATGITDTLNGLVSHSLIHNPFTFTTDIDNTYAVYSQTQPSSLRSRLAGTQGSVLETFRGEYKFNRYNVSMLAHRGNDYGVKIRYGKNLTDLKEDSDVEAVYTGVLAYYYNQNTSTLQTGEIAYLDNHDTYPTERVYVLDASDDFGDETPTVEELTQRAENYRDSNDIGTPKVQMTVNFVPLWQTEDFKEVAMLERVKLGDTVGVIFDKLGVIGESEVVKTEWNVLLDRYNKVTLGTVKANLGDTLVQATQRVYEPIVTSLLESTVQHATDLLRGGLGGYVVINKNAQGQNNEILFGDAPTLSQMVNVMRLNSAGIGFSTDGYNGTYHNAWTIDGKLNASFITFGELNGRLIKAGTILASSLQIGSISSDKLTDDINSTLSKSRDIGQFVNINGSGITITSSGSEYVNKIDNEGYTLTDGNGVEQLKADYEGVKANNLITKQKLTIDYDGFDMNFQPFSFGDDTDQIGCFYVSD